MVSSRMVQLPRVQGERSVNVAKRWARWGKGIAGADAAEVCAGLDAFVAAEGVDGALLTRLLFGVSTEECLLGAAIPVTGVLLEALEGGSIGRTRELAEYFAVVGVYAFRGAADHAVERKVRRLLGEHAALFERWIEGCGDEELEALRALFTIRTLIGGVSERCRVRLVALVGGDGVMRGGGDEACAEWLLALLRAGGGGMGIDLRAYEGKGERSRWVVAVLRWLQGDADARGALLGEVAAGVGVIAGWDRELLDLEREAGLALLCELLEAGKLGSYTAFHVATLLIVKELGWDLDQVSVVHESDRVTFRVRKGRRRTDAGGRVLSERAARAMQACEALQGKASNLAKVVRRLEG